MAKFKVGDRVRYKRDASFGIRKGAIDVIKDVDRDGDPILRDSGVWTADFCFTELAVLIDEEECYEPKKPFMTQVNTMMKKLLDADTRALIEAGYLNSELELTCEGTNELQAIQFEAHKKELVELAKTKIAEANK